MTNSVTVELCLLILIYIIPLMVKVHHGLELPGALEQAGRPASKGEENGKGITIFHFISTK